MRKVYQILANAMHVLQSDNCFITSEAVQFQQEKIEYIEKNTLPHGSGFDGICSLNMDKSSVDALYFDVDYHYMDGDGYYSGWFTFEVIAKPSFVSEISVEVNVIHNVEDVDEYLRDDLKNYVGEVFYDVLRSTVPE